ncbi:MAG: ABC transporter permease [Lewinellaceae bacterium]|nr:ABC transporter permease [Lewinellaceae bacterium]
MKNLSPTPKTSIVLALTRYQNGEEVIATAENVPGAGPAIAAEFPEVEGYARLYNLGYKNNLIITNEAAKPEPVAFKHRRFLYADSAFLPMMGYPLVLGDPATALAQPLQAVISEEYARKYFGNADPMGKQLRMQDDDFNDERVTVTGCSKTCRPTPISNSMYCFPIKPSTPAATGRLSAMVPPGAQRHVHLSETATRHRPAILEAKFPAFIENSIPTSPHKTGATY